MELSPTISFRYLDIGSMSMPFLEQDEDSIIFSSATLACL